MKTIKMHCIINATPEEVFKAITSAFTVELWSGYPARIEPIENSDFSMFDGDITGKILKIVPEKQIVQEWFFGDQPEQSIVTINLSSVKNKTRIDMSHTNVPDTDFEDIEIGWKNYYWGALQEFYK